MCGISGFGSAGIYMPGRNTHEYVDFHAPAPAAARPDMWAHLVEGEARDGFGFVLKGRVNDIGYQSVCVPAALRAFEEIHHRYGTLGGGARRPSNGREMAGWCGRQSSASGSTKARWAARQTRSACASAKPGVVSFAAAMARRAGSAR